MNSLFLLFCLILISYGIRVDKELGFISPHVAFETNQMGQLLTLINQSPYRVVYNQVQLQEQNKTVQTCGRWVSVRLRWRETPLLDFQKVFTQAKGMNPDQWVTALTLL